MSPAAVCESSWLSVKERKAAHGVFEARYASMNCSVYSTRISAASLSANSNICKSQQKQHHLSSTPVPPVLNLMVRSRRHVPIAEAVGLSKVVAEEL